jgi:hypothetical protein
MPTNPVNFLGLEPKYAAYDASRFAVLPIPYDATTSYLAGARHGPDAIIRASWHLEDFDEELLTNGYRQGISTLEAIEPNVDGPEAMHETIYKVARGVVRDGKFLFGLGGDHSVTSGLVRAVRQKHNGIRSKDVVTLTPPSCAAYMISVWSRLSRWASGRLPARNIGSPGRRAYISSPRGSAILTRSGLRVFFRGYPTKSM